MPRRPRIVLFCVEHMLSHTRSPFDPKFDDGQADEQKTDEASCFVQRSRNEVAVEDNAIGARRQPSAYQSFLRPELSGGESTSEIASAVLMTFSRQGAELLNTW